MLLLCVVSDHTLSSRAFFKSKGINHMFTEVFYSYIDPFERVSTRESSLCLIIAAVHSLLHVLSNSLFLHCFYNINRLLFSDNVHTSRKNYTFQREIEGKEKGRRFIFSRYVLALTAAVSVKLW